MEGKFISPEPPPNDQEREILTILIEECAEVQQRATKALRFGLQERQPGQELTNVERLSREVGDLYEIIDVAIERGLIEMGEVETGAENKKRQLAKYMQTADKG